MSERHYTTALEGYGDIMATMEEVAESYKALKKAVRDMRAPIREMDEERLNGAARSIAVAAGVTNAHTARMLEMAGKIMEVVQRQTGGDLECIANGYEEDDHA